MAPSKEAPQQHKQPSRKGKKAWRKNVDVTDVQAGLHEAREEVIKGLVPSVVNPFPSRARPDRVTVVSLLKSLLIPYLLSIPKAQKPFKDLTTKLINLSKPIKFLLSARSFYP